MQDLFRSFKVVDLTHTLAPHIPTWNGSCGFCLEIKKDYDKCFRVQQIKMHAGLGTHMDAPSHRFQEGISIADIPLDTLIAPICLIDVSQKAHSDYEVCLDDLQHYEKLHGKIDSRSLVITYTGWERFWGNTSAYRNIDAQRQMHFPAVSKEVAEVLLEREIAGLAIDTLSPDCLDLTFPVHKLLLGQGKYIIENIAHASLLPPKGSYAIALPLKAEQATEAPLRIIALVPKT
ncbi:MAG: cyclase family protein [Chlamydiae bacterium]|nr:cyclase family protein [Chlamydiota bacterium]